MSHTNTSSPHKTRFCSLQRGKTPLDYAETQEVLSVFAEHSLRAAVRWGTAKQVTELIAKGADVNEKDAVSLGTCLLRFVCDMICAFATHDTR